ncbi:hypothetical protein Ccrd_008824, partial [Cynara cardunculus var. scolymus]
MIVINATLEDVHKKVLSFDSFSTINTVHLRVREICATCFIGLPLGPRRSCGGRKDRSLRARQVITDRIDYKGTSTFPPQSSSGMRVCVGWRQFLLFVTLVFFVTHFLSVLELHQNSNAKDSHQKKTRKFDHLVFGPAAGEGLPNRLQCKGIKALNKTHISSVFNISDTRGGDGVAFVTVFTVYNSSVDGRASDSSIVGKVLYNKVERSMAVLNTFINFIQAFLEEKLEEQSRKPGQISHFIFTDSDIAVVGDVGQIFSKYENFHLALTFRNNKQQPLNSGAKIFLEEVLNVYTSKYMKASRMLGDQLALAWVIKSHASFDAKEFSRHEAFLEEIGGASVLFLPCAVYNWTPPEGAGQFHGMPLDVK